MNNDMIPVKYCNSTGRTDFQVVVFSKSFSKYSPTISYSAWQVFNAQTSIQFNYSKSVSVGASYTEGGQTITAGPFPADLGSTWEITQPIKSDTAKISQKTGISANPDNSIAVKNIAPLAWNGRKFNVEIYKNNQLFLTHPGLRADDRIDFLLHHKLYFGVVYNMRVEQSFASLGVTTANTMFDLDQYPNGIIVTLDQMPGGGKFSFTAKSML